MGPLEESLGGVARGHVEPRELRTGLKPELHHVVDLGYRLLRLVEIDAALLQART